MGAMATQLVTTTREKLQLTQFMAEVDEAGTYTVSLVTPDNVKTEVDTLQDAAGVAALLTEFTDWVTASWGA